MSLDEIGERAVADSATCDQRGVVFGQQRESRLSSCPEAAVDSN
jgi:hypothetical protein